MQAEELKSQQGHSGSEDDDQAGNDGLGARKPQTPGQLRGVLRIGHFATTAQIAMTLEMMHSATGTISW